MSGGAYDYLQFRFTEIIDVIKREIKNNPRNYKPETIAEFKKGIQLLEKAQIYAQRIDWLISDDDGEETFHKRLAEDLSNGGGFGG